MTLFIPSLLLLVTTLLTSTPLPAEYLKIAVASNFANTLEELTSRFEQQTGHNVVIIAGSTGKHYAQIRQGAPFDLFLAADSARPERLEKEGQIIPNSRFTYAIGKLCLWRPETTREPLSQQSLESGDFHHLALANPRLAPYGRAAQEVLVKLGMWHRLQPRIVRGENIGQTYQFVSTGNAPLGFVAFSQIKHARQSVSDNYWLIPQELYTPIEQQAVQLTETTSAQAFMAFLKSEPALQLIHEYGYDTP